MAKILLVEDDNNLREIYEARMLAEGYTVVTASDGEAALAVAAKEKPDLIISDVMMPKISGFEMLDILRNTEGLQETKVIMLTALGQAEDKTRADSLGADKYLVKSQVTLEDIVNTARALLGADNAAAAPAAPPEAPASPAPATPAPVGTPTPQPAAAAPPQPAPAQSSANDPAPAPAADAATPVTPPSAVSPQPSAASQPAPVIPVATPPAPQVAPPAADATTAAPSAPANPATATPPSADNPSAASTQPASATPAPAPSAPATMPTPAAQPSEPVTSTPSTPTPAAPAVSSEPAAIDTPAATPTPPAAQPAPAPPAATTPPPAPADTAAIDDKVVSHAVEQLLANADQDFADSQKPATPAAEKPAAEAAPAVNDVSPPTPKEPSQNVTSISGDQVEVAGKKVIAPISRPDTKPSLEELLAKENASSPQTQPTAADKAPAFTPPQPGASVAPQAPQKDGFDPNSISL